MPLLQVAGDTGWVNAQSIPLLIQGLKNIRMETSDPPCDTHHPAANQQIVVFRAQTGLFGAAPGSQVTFGREGLGGRREESVAICLYEDTK